MKPMFKIKYFWVLILVKSLVLSRLLNKTKILIVATVLVEATKPVSIETGTKKLKLSTIYLHDFQNVP